MFISTASCARALLAASLIHFATSFLAPSTSNIGFSHVASSGYGDQLCIDRIESTALSMDFGNFFNGAFGNDGDKDQKLSQSFDDDDYEEDENSYLGCTNIFTIEAKALKAGGCRLYLSLFLVGEINSPERNTWKMDQNDDGGIDLYYKDTSGAMIITLKDDEIIVNRLGSRPSMDYLMGETAIINHLLDQLDEIAFDNTIDEKDRLLILHEPGDAINIVRESLSFN
jgi:hypothetical protein